MATGPNEQSMPGPSMDHIQQLFNNAIETQRRAQAEALAQMQLQSSQTFTQLSQMHDIYRQRTQVPAFHRILTAARIDPNWMAQITSEADEILANLETGTSNASPSPGTPEQSPGAPGTPGPAAPPGAPAGGTV